MYGGGGRVEMGGKDGDKPRTTESITETHLLPGWELRTKGRARLLHRSARLGVEVDQTEPVADEARNDDWWEVSR